MQGLPWINAIVIVGPPLFWSGPSCGLIGFVIDPVWSPVAVNPLLPSLMPMKL